MNKYSFELLDEKLQTMEVNIPDGDDIDAAKNVAVRILREHCEPVATLIVTDAESGNYITEIDILL